MKGNLNKFSYPQKQVHTYKSYKGENNTEAEEVAAKKNRYKQLMKQTKQNERMHVQCEEEHKRKLEKNAKIQQIKDQIEKKKQQIEQLNRIKEETIAKEQESYKKALQRIQIQRQMEIEKEEKIKEYKLNSQNRFYEAIRRMHSEKEIQSSKERQAQYRRKVTDKAEKMERILATKYKQQMESKAKQNAVEMTYENYKQPLGRIAYNKTIDYTKTCLHNPKIIIPQKNEGKSAIQQAIIQEKNRKNKIMQKEQQQEQNRRRSLERGLKADEKLQRQKQYNKYCSEIEEKQKEYNLNRIQQGKQNGLIGLKPQTLKKMEVNRRVHCTKQFETMFREDKYSVNYEQPAKTYQIYESKMTNRIQEHNGPYEQYSNNNRVQSTIQICQQQNAAQQNEQQAYNYAQQFKKNLQTGLQNTDYQNRINAKIVRHKKHEQLNYSQSQDDHI